MTCTQFREHIDAKDPLDGTRAELAVVAKHYRGCVLCRAWLDSSESGAREFKPEDAEAIRSFVKACKTDREFREVCYGEKP